MKPSRGLVVVTMLLVLAAGCRMNLRKGDREGRGEYSSVVSGGSDCPYEWLTDEEYRQYLRLKADTAWQDSLAAILSARLERSVHMDDFLKMTYTDGRRQYYWNESWGDVMMIPPGFEVAEQANWFWTVSHGTRISGVVAGRDSVTVHVYAGHQVVYMDDDELRESFFGEDLEDASVRWLTSARQDGMVEGETGKPLTYHYYTREGKDAGTGKGIFRKIIRALPESDGTFELTVEYPLPLSDSVKVLIGALSSYPNITRVSQYGSELRMQKQ